VQRKNITQLNDSRSSVGLRLITATSRNGRFLLMKEDPVPHVPGLLLFTQYEGAALREQVAICPPIQRYSVQLNTDPQTLRD
jgi:hypothetical protein